jgi:uncharacterized protein with NRDE domain
VCTLIAAFRLFPRWPLVIAANRDEHLDRAASPPRVWPGDPRFVAPRDEVAGGTWLGLNERGLFVGVTNRFGVARDERRDSRGKLVVEALAESSARSVHRRLAGLRADRFNAFHLFYADQSAACVTWSDGERLRQAELVPGLHIVTERSLGGDDHARTELIRARWQQINLNTAGEEDLAALLRLHAPEPIGGTCIHAPAFNYGTRSSAILFLGDSIAASRFLWAEGNPCTTAYAPQTALIGELARSELNAPRASS